MKPHDHTDHPEHPSATAHACCAKPSPAATGLVIDPVCGMQVDPARAAGSREYNGKTYYFCSSHCKQKFDRDPKQFVK